MLPAMPYIDANSVAKHRNVIYEIQSNILWEMARTKSDTPARIYLNEILNFKRSVYRGSPDLAFAPSAPQPQFTFACLALWPEHDALWYKFFRGILDAVSILLDGYPPARHLLAKIDAAKRQPTNKGSCNSASSTVQKAQDIAIRRTWATSEQRETAIITLHLLHALSKPSTAANANAIAVAMQNLYRLVYRPGPHDAEDLQSLPPDQRHTRLQNRFARFMHEMLVRFVKTHFAPPTSPASTPKQPSPKISKTRVNTTSTNSLIKDVSYFHFPGTTLTVCCITTHSEYYVVGHSAAVHSNGFDAQTGKVQALREAKRRLHELAAYDLCKTLYR